MGPKKILFITYDGLTDQLGQSQILPYVKGLSKRGYKFTILSCEKPDKYAQLGNLIQDLCDEDGITWVSAPFTSNIPIVSKMNDRWRLKQKALRLQKKVGFDMTHCRSYVSAEIGLYLKKKFGVKFLFDMRGLWADEKVDGGNWNQSNPLFKYIYKTYKKKEKFFLEHADYTISLTKAAKKEIYTWQHIENNPVKMQVIPCCVDTALFSSEGENFKRNQKELAVNLGIKESDFVVGYLGSIGTWYMLEEMLDFFKRILIQKPNAKFLIITGDLHSFITDKAAQKGIDLQAVIIRKAQRKEVPLFISLMSFSLFFIRPTYSKISSSPTKLAELMALGVPVVTNRGVGDVDEIVLKNNVGVVINEFNTKGYDAAIMGIMENFFSAALIKACAKKEFDVEVALKKYGEVYSEILA